MTKEKNFIKLKICEGKFTRVYYKDAYIIHFIFKYKLVGDGLNSRCGFPTDKIDNVISILDELNISYKIINIIKNEEKVVNYENNTYDEYLKYSLKQLDIDKKVELIFTKLNTLEQDVLDKKLEEVLSIV